jgi:hypothetical protein
VKAHRQFKRAEVRDFAALQFDGAAPVFECQPKECVRHFRVTYGIRVSETDTRQFNEVVHVRWHDFPPSAAREGYHE